MTNSESNITLIGEQEKALEFLLKRKRTALFLPTGTGKTLVTLLYLKILDKPAIIITPASIKHVWTDENAKWKLNLSISTDYRLAAKIVVVSYDWIKVNEEFLDDYDIVIFDEAHCIADTNTIRYRNLNKIVRTKDRVVLLAGYPVENRLSEIFVVSLITDVLGTNYHSFLRKYFNVQTKKKRVRLANGKFVLMNVVIRAFPKKGSIDKIIELIRPFVFVSDKAKSFTHKIEKKNIVARFELSDYQKTILYNLNNYGRYADDKIQLECPNELTVFGKAMQVISGFVYVTDSEEQKNPVRFDKNPKLDALRKLVESRSDFLLWYLYDYEYEMLKEFKNRCRLSKLQTDSRGLNLQHYKFSVYFTLPLSGGQFLQSVDRLHRIGRIMNVISVVLLPNGAFGDALYRMTDGKHKLTNRFIKDLLSIKI